MLELVGSACIDAPVAAVWTVLSHLDGVHLWIKQLLEGC
jgi:hypothetical protein